MGYQLADIWFQYFQSKTYLQSFSILEQFLEENFPWSNQSYWWYDMKALKDYLFRTAYEICLYDVSNFSSKFVTIPAHRCIRLQTFCQFLRLIKISRWWFFISLFISNDKLDVYISERENFNSRKSDYFNLSEGRWSNLASILIYSMDNFSEDLEHPKQCIHFNIYIIIFLWQVLHLAQIVLKH